MDKRYDPSSIESILKHARLLLGKSLKMMYGNKSALSGKGGLGVCVEKYHFDYQPNSDSRPDFDKVGIELKCTPLKQLSDGSLVSKERLVLNMINYIKEAEATFETSSFWQKNSHLLLLFYLHENGVNILDLIFKIVRYWSFPDVDLKIIKDDWEKLHYKMINGLAHEISEGDTLFLSACTKGSKAGAEMKDQAVKDAPKAQARAYCLKSKYINTIILDSLLHSEMCDNMFVSDSQKNKILKKLQSESNIVNNINEYFANETFEQHVERRFSPYYGKTIYEIESILGEEVSNSPKAISNSVIHKILGVKTPKIKEFEKANLQVKSIRLEYNGVLKESMVFSQIDYKGITEEDNWEDSVWYNTLTQRFLFVVFRKDKDNKKDAKKAVLERVVFWTMPYKDLLIAKDFWEDTKQKIIKDDFNHFWRLSDHKICHVRPKAVNSNDKMLTPSGRMETKKGYWLNSEYILSIINSK